MTEKVFTATSEEGMKDIC